MKHRKINDRPIGIFDSGVGGVSVLRSVREQLPAEDIIYFGDNANLPYGDKPAPRILELTRQSVGSLVAEGCKLVVVACNSASTVSIDEVRRQFPDVPIVLVVPMIKPAAQLTVTGTVAVMGTPATLKSDLYRDLKRRFASGVTVHDIPCPEWVDMVETGQVRPTAVKAKVGLAIQRGADMLVLGCTHFPFLIPQIAPLIGDKARLLHSGPAIARQVERVLGDNGWLRERDTASVSFRGSRDPEAFVQRATELSHMQFDRDQDSVIVETAEAAG